MNYCVIYHGKLKTQKNVHKAEYITRIMQDAGTLADALVKLVRNQQ